MVVDPPPLQGGRKLPFYMGLNLFQGNSEGGLGRVDSHEAAGSLRQDWVRLNVSISLTCWLEEFLPIACCLAFLVQELWVLRSMV